MKPMKDTFSVVSPGAWSAKVPFRLNVGGDDLISIETPLLKPGWYSIAVAFVVNETPIWQGAPVNLRALMNFNTEGATILEETTPNRTTSDFRTLGTDCAGNVFSITYPWPWGAWQDVFHTDTEHVANYTVGIYEGGTPGETVAGYVYLLLKKED